MKKEFLILIFWIIDVNVVVYGEYVFGSGKGLSSVVYYMIGMGVGGGVL